MGEGKRGKGWRRWGKGGIKEGRKLAINVLGAWRKYSFLSDIYFSLISLLGQILFQIFQRRRIKIKTYLFNNFHFFGRNTSLENWRTIWNFWEFCLEIPSLQNKKNSFYFCQELSIYIFLLYTRFWKCISGV